MFFTFFKLYKWYQSAQRITSIVLTELIVILSASYFCCDNDYFIFDCFRKVATPLLDRNKTVFKILMKILVLQLKLMALVMVYVEICARVNVPVYCNKAAGIDMQNYAVAGVKQYITC